MTEKQKYAIKLAIDTMDKQISRHCNTVYGNRRTGVTVGYGEAINILSDMVTDNDSKQTNADRIRDMSDEELAEWIHNMCEFEKDEEPYRSIYNLDTEKEEEIHDSYGDLLKWLQSEAEQKRT